MLAPKDPVATVAPKRRSSDQFVEQRCRFVGRGGRDERRPATLASVAVQGELADHQDFAADLGNRFM